MQLVIVVEICTNENYGDGNLGTQGLSHHKDRRIRIIVLTRRSNEWQVNYLYALIVLAAAYEEVVVVWRT